MDIGSLSSALSRVSAGGIRRSESASTDSSVDANSTGRSGKVADVVAETRAEATKRAAPGGVEGLYTSPVLKYDQSARVAVLFFRDFDTGETRDQIPTERAIERYRQGGATNGADRTTGGASRSTDAADGGTTAGESTNGGSQAGEGGQSAPSFASAESSGIGGSSFGSGISGADALAASRSYGGGPLVASSLGFGGLSSSGGGEARTSFLSVLA